MKRTVFIATILMLGLSPLLQAQMFGPSFSSYVYTAPEKALEGVKKVAILNFNNPSSTEAQNAGSDFGTRMADYLVANLLEEQRGKGSDAKTYVEGGRTNIYQVIERSQLESILAEQKLSVSGAIDENQAAEIGKLLGVDAIITGSVSYGHKDEETTSSYKDKNGNVRYSYCTKRMVTAEGRIKIISVQTAQLLANFTPTQNATDNKCDDKRSGLASPASLADKAFRVLARRVSNSITPYYYRRTFQLKKLKTKEYKDKGKEAVDYLKAGKINEAYTIYKAIYDIDPYVERVAFNLGALYEAAGNYEASMEAYGVAAQLDDANKAYLAGYNRAERGKAMEERLSDFGVSLTPYTFSANANALADKVTTKGSRNERYECTAEPGGGAVVAKIPGGLEFVVLETSGDFVQLKLLGGKKGWISKDKVK